MEKNKEPNSMENCNFKPCTVWVGDNIEIMRGMNSKCVDLIYLDPPFNSNRNYENPIGMETAQEGIINSEKGTFKDIWTLSDVNRSEHGELADKNPGLYKIIDASRDTYGESMMAYLIMMSLRILEMHRILKDTGSIYLHCDSTASHYLKLVMDVIFGKRNFLNEIIWSHQGSWIQPNNRFPRRHDTILLYTKTETYTFNITFEDNIEEQVNYNRWRKFIVGDKIYGGNMPIHDKRFAPYINRFKKEYNRDPLDNDIVCQLTGSRVGTVTYVKVVDPKSKEHIGYPTQKPIALLNRIIETSSNKGDIVFDPFCGCATTLVSANILERNWVGCDLSEVAVGLVKKRMDDVRGTLPMLWDSGDVVSKTDFPIRTDTNGDTPNYKTNKHVLFAIQKGICSGCHNQFQFQVFTIDHIVPTSEGGQDNFENLQLLCNFCNSSKGKKSMAEWLSSRNKSHFPMYRKGFNPRYEKEL